MVQGVGDHVGLAVARVQYEGRDQVYPARETWSLICPLSLLLCELERADVTGSPLGSRSSALIGGEGALGRINRINRRAAGEQGVGRGVATVIGQGVQHGIAGVRRAATAIPVQAVDVGTDCAFLAEDAVPIPRVIGDDGIHQVQRTSVVDVDAAAAGNDHIAATSPSLGTVVTDSAVYELQRAADVSTAADGTGVVAADGAVANHHRAFAGDMEGTTGATST